MAANIPVVQDGYSSDDDLTEIEKSYSITFFSRKEKIPGIATTIPCCDRNIKGNILIKMAHELVQSWAEEAIDYACEPEKDNGGFAMIPPPTTHNLSLSISDPREWPMCLGGWKGMMPNEEVKDFFFFQFDLSLQEKKFDSVSIFNDDIKFPIKNHRIHMPDNFVIGNFDVTEHSVKSKNGKWVKCSGKTDLSYSQILSAIGYIKKSYSITDSQIAQLQLWGLARSTKEPDWAAQLNPLDRKQVVIFLDYLNALMFGVEASGLNASLLISAMMLDLIASGQYSYKIAFKVNDHGGVYPYACFGNNKGTYNEREKAMLLDPPSMCAWRNRPELSPVAIKEAILIKVWLKHSGVLDTKLTYEEQIKCIDHAMRDLRIFYFSPWLRYCYSIEKFKICPERNHTEDVYARKNKGLTM